VSSGRAARAEFSIWQAQSFLPGSPIHAMVALPPAISRACTPAASLVVATSTPIGPLGAYLGHDGPLRGKTSDENVHLYGSHELAGAMRPLNVGMAAGPSDEATATFKLPEMALLSDSERVYSITADGYHPPDARERNDDSLPLATTVPGVQAGAPPPLALPAAFRSNARQLAPNAVSPASRTDTDGCTHTHLDIEAASRVAAWMEELAPAEMELMLREALERRSTQHVIHASTIIGPTLPSQLGPAQSAMQEALPQSSSRVPSEAASEATAAPAAVLGLALSDALSVSASCERTGTLPATLLTMLDVSGSACASTTTGASDMLAATTSAGSLELRDPALGSTTVQQPRSIGKGEREAEAVGSHTHCDHTEGLVAMGPWSGYPRRLLNRGIMRGWVVACSSQPLSFCPSMRPSVQRFPRWATAPCCSSEHCCPLLGGVLLGSLATLTSTAARSTARNYCSACWRSRWQQRRSST